MERKAQKAMRDSQRSGDNQNNGANSGSRIVVFSYFNSSKEYKLHRYSLRVMFIGQLH